MRCSDISHEFRRHAVAGLNKKAVPILWACNVAEIGFAYARRGFNERIENDFEIKGRAALERRRIAHPKGLGLRRFSKSITAGICGRWNGYRSNTSITD